MGNCLFGNLFHLHNILQMLILWKLEKNNQNCNTFNINDNYISIQSCFYHLCHIARKENVPIYYGTNISEALTYMLTRLTNLLLGEAFFIKHRNCQLHAITPQQVMASPILCIVFIKVLPLKYFPTWLKAVYLFVRISSKTFALVDSF